MTKNSSKLIVLGILFLLSASIVNAVGIAIPPMPNGEYTLNDNDNEDFIFILKNDDAVQRVVKFKVSVPESSGVLLNDNFKFENQYVLQPHSAQNIVVDIETDEPMIVPLDYGYSIQAAGSGQIVFDTWVTSSFDLDIGPCSSSCYSWRFGIDLEYDEFEIRVEGESLQHIEELQVFNENGRVLFEDADIDLTDFDESVIVISENRIEVDSEVFEDLNIPARLTMYDLDYDRQNEILILKDGKECISCDIVSYDDDEGKLIFDVEGFSVYTTEKDDDYVFVEDDDNNGDSTNDGIVTTENNDNSNDNVVTTAIPVNNNEDGPVPPPARANEENLDSSALDAFRQRTANADSGAGVVAVSQGSLRTILVFAFLVMVIGGIIVFIFTNYKEEEIKKYLGFGK